MVQTYHYCLKMKVFKEIVVLVLFMYGVNSANILGITTVLSHSHHLWCEILAMGLVERGHNVTLLSYFKTKKQHANYTVMAIEGGYEKAEAGNDLEECANGAVPFTTNDIWNGISCMIDANSETIRALLNYPKDYKFDLILWDMTGGDCLFPLVKRFGNPPIVGLSPFGIQPHVTDIMGGHTFNYVPNCVSYPTDRVNFWQRLINTYHNINYNYVRRQYQIKVRKYAVEIFGEDVADFRETERKISIALVNAGVNFDFPQLLPPNIISVGGLQAAKPKPLPKDLKKILDDAKDGAIYFSLGTNVQSEKMGENFFNSFTKCFAKLPYTVLWKIDANDRSYPKNVITRTWMPQNDILVHPNTKLFITHGGALSTQEAMTHGVPLVGLPLFLDQTTNLDKIEARHLGRKLINSKLSEKYVCDTINEVIGNKMYKENMRLVSQRAQDQESTPLERAVFWVEYVLRHGNAEHLSPASRDMSFIEVVNLDIILFVLIVASSPLLLVACCCCYRKTTNKKMKKH